MKILVINGPNMNMLEKRDKESYGDFSLSNLNNLMKSAFPKIKFRFFQSNHEGKIIDRIQKTNKFQGIIINPAGYTHSSVAIRDALELVKIIKVEVHLSSIQNREDFRRVSLMTDVVDTTISGKKEKSYLEAVDFIIEKSKI